MFRPSRLCYLLLSLVSGIAIQASSQVVTPTRARVPESFAHGLVVKKVDPVYPQAARSAKLQGTVVLRVIVSKSGDVQSAIPQSGEAALRSAAVEAVKQWKYKPYLLAGQPIEMETTVSVDFSLEEEAPPMPTGPPPGGLPTSGVIGGIISATPEVKPRVAMPTRVRVSSGVSSGLLRTKVDPTYPPDALRTRIQGMVVLKANIDKEGNVYKLEPVSGHELLIPSAMEAVKQWKYKPYLLNSQPVEVETEVVVNFTLAGG